MPITSFECGPLQKGDLVWILETHANTFSKAILIEHGINKSTVEIDGQPKSVPSNLLFQRCESSDCPDDLTQLSILNAPTVLSSLRSRYIRSLIYTQCGIVLVAINPFTQLPNFYKHNTGIDAVHIYRIAEKSLRDLIEIGKSQSIIISGESGAGKTCSAKFIMSHIDYLLKGDSNSILTPNNCNINEALLATNPVLEAFGNARTSRNDNSSRFGKYIKIFIDNADGGKWSIKGAVIETFLLEKSRVLDESTFHIFGILKDAKELRGLEEEVEKCGISKEEWRYIMDELKGIILLKQLELQNSEAPFHEWNELERIYQLESNELLRWLTHKSIQVKDENIITPLSLEDSIYTKDSLIKYLYNRLFRHLVNLLNKKLKPENGNSSTNYLYVGILDIYGFENLNRPHGNKEIICNGFEQLCINYANEKLQNAFIKDYIKSELSIYREEGIIADEVRFEFKDNSACIDFIRRGFNLLEEECRIPKGTDCGFVSKLHELKSDFIKSGRFGENESFILKHFAYDVEYHSLGFLEQNRGTINLELRQLFDNEASIHNNRKKGVCLSFDESLSNLLTNLGNTNCHYIRCIKPNDLAEALKFDPSLVYSQLDACGIIATIQLAKAGFPSKWDKDEIRERFWLLGKSVEEIFSGVERSSFTIGCRRLVFMKDGVISELDRKKRQKLTDLLTTIQRYFYWKSSRSMFDKCLEGASLIQRTFRICFENWKTKIIIVHFRLYFRMKLQKFIRNLILIQIVREKIISLKKRNKIARENALKETQDAEKKAIVQSVQVHQLSEASKSPKSSSGDKYLEEEIELLKRENQRLKQKVAFLAETSSSLNVSYQTREEIIGQLIFIVQLFPSADDLFLPAKRIYFLLYQNDYLADGSIFTEMFGAIRTAKLYVNGGIMHRMHWLSFWISNCLELLGFYTHNQISGGSLIFDHLNELFDEFMGCLRIFVNKASVSLITHKSIHNHQESAPSRRSTSSFLSWFMKLGKKEVESLEDLDSLIKDLKRIVTTMINTQLDASLSQSLWTWFLSALHSSTFNYLMIQPGLSWTRNTAIQVQYNLSLLDDFINTVLTPLFQPQNFNFSPLKQILRLIIAIESPRATTEKRQFGEPSFDYETICPSLTRSQVRHCLIKIASSKSTVANGNTAELALEELVDYGQDPVELDADTSFCLKLSVVPRTPPL